MLYGLLKSSWRAHMDASTKSNLEPMPSQHAHVTGSLNSWLQLAIVTPMTRSCRVVTFYCRTTNQLTPILWTNLNRSLCLERLLSFPQSVFASEMHFPWKPNFSVKSMIFNNIRGGPFQQILLYLSHMSHPKDKLLLHEHPIYSKPTNNEFS